MVEASTLDAATSAAAAATAALDISDEGASAKPSSMVEQLQAEAKGDAVISSQADIDALAAVSKTEASQHLKGNQSYYYWHSDAERRRQAGEKPAPPPLPKKLASSEVAREKRVKAIEAFSFLDDSATIKVYIELTGGLANISSSDVEAEFSERSLLVTVDTPEVIYKFTVDRLAYRVDPMRCKASVTKSRKLLLKLHKENHIENWTKLRAVN